MDFWELVQQTLDAYPHWPRDKAVRHVVHQHPHAHRRLLADANAGRQGHPADADKIMDRLTQEADARKARH